MLEEKKTPNFRIEIHGFTDSIGEPRENLILSEKRANFVKNIFIENYNLPKEIIVTFGKADAEPIASNYIAEGRRKNRRVKIIVIVDNLKELDYEEIWRDVITEFMNKNNEVENEDKKEEEQKKENEQSKN
ncbi:MAG TPA: OmpA family protein [bacterium]|nr:OmpA family protein [bacterium]HOL47363.1 OmpA family protein [bacterium]HPQ18904.1 OmpA family protein [bacterium]